MSPAYWTARALNSAFGTELYSGFDRGYDVGPYSALGVGDWQKQIAFMSPAL